MFPIRCFTCGYVIAQHECEYKNRIKAGEKAGDILDSMNVKSYCCRRMFLGYVDMMEKLLSYPNINDSTGLKNFNIDK